MRRLSIIFVFLIITFGFSLTVQAQTIITSDSMDAQLRNIPEEIFRRLKSQQVSETEKKFKSIDKSEKVYTIPTASENNILKLTLANTTKRNIRDLTISVQELPEWLKIGSSFKKIDLLSTGDIAEVSFKFDLIAQVAEGKKADIVFVVSSNSYTSKKIISIVSGEPLSFKLNQNYPNPFNPSTTISYRLPSQMKVKVTIFNLLGQKVATLFDGFQQAGVQTLRWDASRYASGLYFYRIVAKGENGKTIVRNKKMMLIK